MSDLTRKTAAELSTSLASGEVSAVEVVQAHLDAIDRLNPTLNAYLAVDADGALEVAKRVDADRAAGKDLHPLAGVPVSVKDSIVTKGLKTTAASKMLENWVPPYDATVVSSLKDAGMPILGKTNLDELSMGSTTKFSAFGPTRNPWDVTTTPGGSGGGSAAALAAYLGPLSVGSDTGGSIREPAALTGTVGVKPTYGAVSRYGLIALSSSMDHVGPAARTVQDAALLHDLIAFHDPRDATSPNGERPSTVAAVEVGNTRGLDGVKVGVLTTSHTDLDPALKEVFDSNLKALEDAGAHLIEVECPSFTDALAVYTIIMAAEASSNLARLDGMRYGLRVEPESGAVTAERVMAATRGAGFGPEVKRRILLGTHVLSASQFESHFLNAQRLRTRVLEEWASVFSRVDVVASPATAATATGFQQAGGDLIAGYCGDVATIPANLAGLPAMSVPAGVVQGLPVGLQFIAPAGADERVYHAGAAFDTKMNNAGPILQQAPSLEEGK